MDSPLGREGSAPLVPGFRGFREFCLPLAGGFKGWWYRPAGDEFYSPLGGHRPPLEASPLHHFVVPLPPQAVGGKA